LEARLLQPMEETPPEYRAEEIAKLASEHGVSKAAIQHLIDFYALHYYEEPKMAGDTTEFWNRAEEINRALRFTEPRNRLEARYLIYIHLITQKSVPQIAQLLGITEAEARKEMSELGISILGEFE